MIIHCAYDRNCRTFSKSLNSFKSNTLIDLIKNFKNKCKKKNPTYRDFN